MTTLQRSLLLLVLACSATLLRAQDVVCSHFVCFDGGDLLLTDSGAPRIYVDATDQKGVRLAATNLCADFGRVCGHEATLTTDASEARILVGTLGHSAAIDALVKGGQIEGSLLRGCREKFICTVVGGQLVIAGSDRRGTIYGIYELSSQMGVSPWYWWADVPVESHARVYANKGVFTAGEPAVELRGLFLNDEGPCLMTWVKNHYGTNVGDHRFYARVFELILRLRGNFMWPAMWDWAFYADDPLNSTTADEMGVIIGTSHHEPMARNHKEWGRRQGASGPWNYQTNQAVLDRFFREGIERMQGTEDIVTIGMRGDGDEAMSEEADTRLLERIVKNQRRIIQQVTHRPARETPQVWALYKEVLDYYDRGMRVPDDVCILLCDDNWGNVRRVPTTPEERRRGGGWGLYYHVDYVGAPRNTKWLNVTPSQNIWEQLTLAYENGLQRLWILNVGDLKPMEYPITLFMDMAWNPASVGPDVQRTHTRRFCAQQFGEAQAAEASRILDHCCKLAGRCTAELLDARTYNLQTGEWRRVADEYMRLEAEALRQYILLPQAYRDAYQELILFPVQAMSNLHQMYYAQAMNLQLHAAGDPDCNLWADRAEEAFRRDSLLCRAYNKELAGGKWDGMMVQLHIGYTSWNDDFGHERLPELHRLPATEPTALHGGFVFQPGADGIVRMEAEHCYQAVAAPEAAWTVIPSMGRTRSAVTLRPTTAATGEAALLYRFRFPEAKEVRVHVVVKTTLDFLNQGALAYEVSLDGSQAERVAFNRLMNERPENLHTHYYPVVARRIKEDVVTLPLPATADGLHTLRLHPCDPGIVFEKVIVEAGGYVDEYLFGEESGKTKS